MKILLASVDFTPHTDGVSTLSAHYARRLAERGHAVRVVGPQAPGAAEDDAAAPYATRRFRGYGLGLLRFAPFALCVWREIRERRPEVVLAMNIGYGGVLCNLWRRRGGPRYVTVAYAYEFLKFRRTPMMRSFYRRIYRDSEFTIAISGYTRDRLVEFGVDAATISIVEPGAELAGRPGGDAAPKRGGPVVGTCGRVIRRKGHDRVIRALPALVGTFPEIRYVVAGAGPERDRLETLARSLGVADRVEFAGRLPAAGLRAFYESLDLFVMPAREDVRDGHVEGFGIVFLEAALCGVPSLGTRTGGIPEAIVDGVTGRLVDPSGSDKLAMVMEAMLAAPDELKRMGAAARERAVTEYNWDHQVDRVAELLEERMAHE